jgi:hypothetical protein
MPFERDPGGYEAVRVDLEEASGRKLKTRQQTLHAWVRITGLSEEDFLIATAELDPQQ